MNHIESRCTNLSLFAVLSIGILIMIGMMYKHLLRMLFTLAISADFYSVVANNIGIGLGFWNHPYRIYSSVFQTSIIYDMLFFPSTLVLYLVWMPCTRLWQWLYSLLWAASLSLLELWLEQTTDLIEYGRGWLYYKTGLLYLVTYVVFYWLYRWLSGHFPGEPNTSGRNRE